MSAGWALGAFFFIFIFAAIIFILATKASQPVEPSLGEIERIPSEAERTPDGKYRIRRDYRIEIPPRAFVNYPYGLRVVFPLPASNGPIGNARRGFSESDYVRWAPPDQDPHLIVRHGHVEFQAEQPEPLLQVSARFPPGSFEGDQLIVECPLHRDRETVFPLWLNPLKEQTGSVKVACSLVTRNGQHGKLAEIPVDVNVESFPIRLR